QDCELPLTFFRVLQFQNWGFPIKEKLDLKTHVVETAWTRRIEPYPRDEFIFNICLFAIFCGCRLWGLKTPAI
ncbi:hypothetical protein, partial [Salmonella enterica]|uniref:hypothetical protein n=1 Tax=Salmonella enterica TaxID=28901 RepID=UPI00329731BB